MNPNTPGTAKWLMAGGLFLALISAGHAQVTVGTGYSTGDGAYATTEPGQYYWVDVFTVPANNPDLTSISAWYNDGTSGDTAVVSLYSWNGTTETGSALFSGTQAIGNTAPSPITFSGLNIALSPGSTYAINFSATNVTTAYYNGSDSQVQGYFYEGSGEYAPLGTSSLDLSATFSPSVSATPVPEYSWLVWSGIGLIAGLAFLVGRRQAGSAEVLSILQA